MRIVLKQAIRVPLWSLDGVGQRGLSTVVSSSEASTTKNYYQRSWKRSLKNIWSNYRLPALSRLLGKSQNDTQLRCLEGSSGLVKRLARNSESRNIWRLFTTTIRSWTRFDGQAAQLRREFAKRILLSGAKSTPLLSLIGICLASNDGLVTDSDKMNVLCRDIRVTFSTLNNVEAVEEREVTQIDSKTQLNLSAIRIGDVIAKGCNAIVYSAKLAAEHAPTVTRTISEGSDDSGTASSIEVLSTNEDDDFTENIYPANYYFQPKLPKEENSIQTVLNQPFNGYNLAVKMMFNYEAESNAAAILQAMYKELVPSPTPVQLLDNIDKDQQERRKCLPKHPNIVKLDSAFADCVPPLPQAMKLYPDALPFRLNENGSGRNMTLFLLMKRYHCSLKDYLRLYEPPARTRLLLIAQLFEGIVHLVRNEVAHRDLKTDNILLDLSQGLDHPKLVITDFGCCLADENLGLQLPYYTAETSRGGNSALMAPEVACAQAGRFTVIDYRKADLWAAGTLAYEILGFSNPFLHGNPARLDNRTYTEKDLITPSDKNANPTVWRLIKSILQRDPIKRPEVNVAADICAVLLFAPERWQKKKKVFVDKKVVIDWLVSFAAKTIVENKKWKLSEAEHQLALTFLRRVTFCDVMKAVEFLHVA